MNDKAITIKQPYSHLICKGIKDIENRTWKTKYRGRVYIHSSATYAVGHRDMIQLFSREQWGKIEERGLQIQMVTSSFSLSAIIGYVDLVDIVENHSSIWAIEGHYHWVLANPVMFDKPILDVKGKLSLWDCSKYIHSEIDEDGKPVCMCNLGIDEKDQVYRLFEEFRCKYCDGKWYK